MEVVNNGHTVQINYPQGSTLTINNQEYALRQFHFHTPSEHQVDEEAYAMELHLVHQKEAGKLAVVGVLIEEGETNTFLESIWENMPQEKGENKVSGVSVDAKNFLPTDRSFYH